MSDAENKLAAARTKLILDKPFLGALEKPQGQSHLTFENAKYL